MPPRSGRGGTDPATKTGNGMAGAARRTRFDEASASRTTKFRLLVSPGVSEHPSRWRLLVAGSADGAATSAPFMTCEARPARCRSTGLLQSRALPRGRETPSLAATLNRRSKGSGLGRAPLHRFPVRRVPRRGDSTCGGTVYQYESPRSRPESQPVPATELRCRQPDRPAVRYGTGSGPGSPASRSS